MQDKKYKIFMGLNEVAGYYTNLQKGFDQLGVKNTFVDLGKNKFNYEYKQKYNFIINLIKKVGNKIFDYEINRDGSLKNETKLKFWRFIRTFLKSLLFLRVLPSHDVFIFAGRNSFFMNKTDLKILKFFKKKIIFMYHGSDSRPPYLNGAFIDESPYEIIKKTRRWKHEINLNYKYADYVINYPAYSQFYESRIINNFALGNPYYNNNEPVSIPDKNKIKILHSPSKPKLKGTYKIRQIIESIKEKYENIEYVEITDQSNSVVLKHLSDCDFVVDQLYSNSPMGGFATEAAFLGKPAVVGSYYKDYIKNDIPAEYIPPGIYCSPDEAESAIEKLILDEEYRQKVGREVKDFICNKWNPKIVAENYLRLINNDFPENWYYDPLKLRYAYGWGISSDELPELIKKTLHKKRENKKNLCLSHNPELEELIVNFMGI